MLSVCYLYGRDTKKIEWNAINMNADSQRTKTHMYNSIEELIFLYLTTKGIAHW